MFWKTFLFSKVFLWTRRMQFQQTRQKSRHEAKNFCSVSENDKNIHLFSKTVFFRKRFYRYGECSFDRWAKLFLLNYRKWSIKKIHKRCKKFSKIFSAKNSHGELESSFKAPLTSFSTASRIISARYSEKKHFISFLKDFHPKVSVETENPVLTTPLNFVSNFGQKNCPVSKNEKKISNKAVICDNVSLDN